MDLSVVVVSWNNREVLARCLASLFQHTGGLEWEVIVVDNGSQDGSAQMVKSEFPQATVLENSLNLGFAAATNQGIGASRGDYVFLLNSDTWLETNVLLGLMDFMRSHPRAGAVGCRLMGPHGEPQAYAFGREPTLGHLVGRALARSFRKEEQLLDRSQEVDWVSAAAIALRRRAVEQVGLLDEGMFMYFEDVDLCLRLRRAGWQVWLVPHLSVVHLGGGTPLASGQRRDLYYRSLRYFYRKHYGRLQAALLSLLLLVYRLGVTSRDLRAS